jgi:hypothetical protein
MIVMMVRDHQPGRFHVGRNDSVSQIAKLVGDVERFLVFQMNAGSRDDGDSAFIECAVEWCERDAFA